MRNVKIEFNPLGEIVMYNPDGGIIFELPNNQTIVTYKDLITRSKSLHQYEDTEYLNIKEHKRVITRDRNIWFTKKHSITPTSALKILRGFISNEIVKKYPHYHALVRSTQVISAHHPNLSLVAYESEAEQAVKDGIRNIAPLIIALQKTPKELKEYLGKSLWKSLCKNSYTRNLLIARRYIRSLDYRAGTDKDKIELIVILNKFPSTVISKRTVFEFNSVGLYCLKVLKEQFKIPYCKIDTGNNHRIRNEVVSTVRDTIYELNQDGVEVKLDWSYRRFKEEHEKIIKNRAERYKRQEEARKEKFKLLKTVDIRTLHKKLDMIEFNGVKATPLTSFDAVRQEGDDMHHCVGGYAERCAMGEYVVYSLVAVDGTRSTLGISVRNTELVQTAVQKVLNPNKTKYTFNQHYLACNQPVQDKDVLTCATKVVEYLNS